MKKFTFSLERVLGWRRTQARLEELKLERLYTERWALEARRKFLAEESSRTLAGVLAASPVTGSDLEALDRFRKSSAAQADRVGASVAELDRKIAAQMEAVTARRRDARLIEQLRDDKFRAWHRAVLKEVDQQAEEVHVHKFGAVARPQ